MNTKWMHHPTHGFRFSLTDGLAIVVCAAATYWGLGQMGSIAWLFPFVLGHFFLFCNVFRIPRRPELVWAGCFLGLATIGLIVEWPITSAMLAALPVTIAVLIYSVRLPTYHGVFSRKN
ncbi:hypothetical protein SAMN06265222_106301 [Neorhodopirellula lusitana]|uniref:Uncharacterized protein n=1 Tax=Neorhodopirellula lusitana TaxID=445327 RepID=A0ABY1Q7T5_9BACT|nr:hypothetical protein [Neorhodopirellula lusitana]SMP60002.1 hypothetical protein SAMN06265222_106301 [Neorhodopirellula lusitana]